jgi:hypothetical protein
MYYEANTWPVDTLIRGVKYIYIYISSDQHSTGYGDSWILRLGERERERDNIMFNHDVWDMMYPLLRAVGTKFNDTNVAHGQQDFSTNLIQGPPYMPSDSKFSLFSRYYNRNVTEAVLQIEWKSLRERQHVHFCNHLQPSLPLTLKTQTQKPDRGRSWKQIILPQFSWQSTSSSSS